MILTKLTKLPAQYQQWLAADLTDGDIIDVWTSLGLRAAHSVTIESIGGDTTLRFNVVEKVYRQKESWIGAGQGNGVSRSPLLLGEDEKVTPNIVITSGTSQQWLSKELTITDIKIITKSSGLKITCT